MTEVQALLDRIILRLKQQDAFSGVRFLREYSAEAVETPVRVMTAAVCLAGLERGKGYLGGIVAPSLRGECYSVKADILVYAPHGENGSGLSELVGKLITGLEAADEERLITETSAGSIEFDADMNAVFRRVSFGMELCLCREE